ncbi:MAG: tRNA (5-methylaminomethyl-2-thiouridylate)-methyltransferase [Candidatus Saccharicenans subterraneus]|uniref:tRNA (5-methylaminomethyl-2-thiouridylate)-methyltransferase n=1 Tax=Candidatus Saccharicenans subterraneus TaxID=2508984 RepID=A0A3E2BLR6_9BACT|nr:MAG: tRNA (5-methylaminomethyl-2-thiouridylate)-methyltransferase [Candidatus Saccharicenans subterraneum]
MEILEIKKPGEKRKKARALLLFSGGLDSILAGKLLEEQDVEIVALTFRSQFFGAGQAVRLAGELGWPLVVVDISPEQIEIVENPRYGYGRQLNPCIDCHGQMVRIAGQLLERYQADFVATGEVVGERPKSQNRQALGLVEKLSGIKGLVLRPLSARLLPETIPEERGLVDRNRLLDIFGRYRKKQLELAERYGLKEYPTPAGGCLLTDPGFAARARQLMKWRGKLWPGDIELIKTGRVFFEPDGLIVVGRDEQENEKIAAIAGATDILVTTAGVKGPLAAVRLKEASPLAAGGVVESSSHDAGVNRAGKDWSGSLPGPGPRTPLDDASASTGRGAELARMVRQIQEGTIRPEKPETGSFEAEIASRGVVRKAGLLVIRYSRRARDKERASAAVIHRGLVYELEFQQADWKDYL